MKALNRATATNVEEWRQHLEWGRVRIRVNFGSQNFTNMWEIIIVIIINITIVGVRSSNAAAPLI